MHPAKFIAKLEGYFLVINFNQNSCSSSENDVLQLSSLAGGCFFELQQFVILGLTWYVS